MLADSKFLTNSHGMSAQRRNRSQRHGFVVGNRGRSNHVDVAAWRPRGPGKLWIFQERSTEIDLFAVVLNRERSPPCRRHTRRQRGMVHVRTQCAAIPVIVLEHRYAHTVTSKSETLIEAPFPVLSRAKRACSIIRRPAEISHTDSAPSGVLVMADRPITAI